MAFPDDYEFPAPPSTPLELSFRRLLRKCEARAQGAEEGWRTDPVFHSYIGTLQEYLSDLVNNNAAGLEPPLLEQYRIHVTMLAKALQPPNLPAYCLQASKLDRITRKGVAGARGAELRSGLAASSPGPRPSAEPPREGAGSAGVRERLDMHRNLQESLIEDLSDLTRGLKGNTLAVEEQLRRRAAVLDEADRGLERSTDTMKKNAALAGKVEQKSRSMTCYTLLVLCGVMGILMGMAVFIKLTSIAGYRAPTGRTEL
mmetsp:Transcript_34227/g.85684  ORF Transcript_34227/g.85684 Transcript_34227/m.85684 type:complete len:258 (+) Transcript_34227:321-1094(+)